jgi:hypothetical protein
VIERIDRYPQRRGSRLPVRSRKSSVPEQVQTDHRPQGDILVSAIFVGDDRDSE